MGSRAARHSAAWLASLITVAAFTGTTNGAGAAAGHSKGCIVSGPCTNLSLRDDPHGAFDNNDVVALGNTLSGDTYKNPVNRAGWGDSTPNNSN
jgi:hypothetical protein